LKVLAREGHECRIKHRQDVGGSSTHAPATRNKQLAKKRRPSSLHEESSPDASSPRGGTPESPDEVDCLKIRPPVIHTNRDIVNYNKEDPMTLMNLWNQPCYNSAKERGTNQRFWAFFHQDWYQTVLYPKIYLVVQHHWVHIDYISQKKDMHFNRVLKACDFHSMTDLLQFHHNWNQEVITKFYSTLFFDKKERFFAWMTNGRRFTIKLTQFAQILGLSSQLDIPKKLHSGRVMMPRKMTPMYNQNNYFQAP
jgi:hypothetical protein